MNQSPASRGGCTFFHISVPRWTEFSLEEFVSSSSNLHRRTDAPDCRNLTAGPFASFHVTVIEKAKDIASQRQSHQGISNSKDSSPLLYRTTFPSFPLSRSGDSRDSSRPFLLFFGVYKTRFFLERIESLILPENCHLFSRPFFFHDFETFLKDFSIKTTRFSSQTFCQIKKTVSKGFFRFLAPNKTNFSPSAFLYVSKKVYKYLLQYFFLVLFPIFGLQYEKMPQSHEKFEFSHSYNFLPNPL